MSNNKFNFVDDVDSITDKSKIREEKVEKSKKNKKIEISKKDKVENKTTSKNMDRKIYFSFEMRVAIMLLFIIILFSSTCFFMVKAFNLDKKEKVTYSEVSDIKYNVCLNEND